MNSPGSLDWLLLEIRNPCGFVGRVSAVRGNFRRAQTSRSRKILRSFASIKGMHDHQADSRCSLSYSGAVTAAWFQLHTKTLVFLLEIFFLKSSSVHGVVRTRSSVLKCGHEPQPLRNLCNGTTCSEPRVRDCETWQYPTAATA